MAKDVTIKVKGASRVRAQFLAAGTAIKAGVLNILSKVTIGKADSQYKGDDLATVTIGSSKAFSVMAVDLRGAHDEYARSVKDQSKVLPLFVTKTGEPVKDEEEGYVNPNLMWEVTNGTLSLAV